MLDSFSTPSIGLPPKTSRLATPARTATPVATLALVLVIGAAVTFAPFVAPIVLAAWAAHLARRPFASLSRTLRGPNRAAGVLTAGIVFASVIPLALAAIAIVPATRSLVDQLRAATGGKGALAALVSNGGGDGKSLVDLAKEYGAGASRFLAAASAATIAALLGAFVFLALFYAFLVEGRRWWQWVREHAFAEPTALDRLAGAFQQTGRGLIVGTGLTALIQGGLATILYAAFGVPRAILFGMLSVLAALIPMTGPMIVWVPVCAGLALTGHVGRAIGLAVLCAGVVGTVDNVVRPWLSQRFAVGMPAVVVLVSMLGGIVVVGGWGIFLGPLVVRLAGETLSVCKERRVFGQPI